MMCCLNPQLEQEVYLEVMTSMIVPAPIILHAKSNGGWQWIRMGVLTSRIPGLVIRGEGLVSDDTMLEGAMSEIGVILERHDDGGDDDRDSSRTTDFFYPSRSHTIPEVV